MSVKVEKWSPPLPAGKFHAGSAVFKLLPDGRGLHVTLDAGESSASLVISGDSLEDLRRALAEGEPDFGKAEPEPPAGVQIIKFTPGL